MSPHAAARAALGLTSGYEAFMGVRRFQARKSAFAAAHARAVAIGKPLVVVGDPDAGAQTRLLRAYGCGDITIDLTGAPSCPRGIVADITRRVPLDDASGVVFVSCVFEYVTDAPAAYRECMRIAGSRENLFIVPVQPFTITAALYPGARWVMHADGSFTPVSDATKAAVALGVAGLIWASFT